MNEKISFQQLSELLSRITGSSVATSELFIKEFFATIADNLAKGESVKIKNFGVFSPSGLPDKPVIFAPTEDLAGAINMPFACFEAVELNDDISIDRLNECDEEYQIDPTIDNIDVEEGFCAVTVSDEQIEETQNEVINPNTTSDDLATPDQGNEISDGSEVCTENESEVAPCENGEGNYKTLLWLWILISLAVGLIVGYLVGNIYPYNYNQTIVIVESEKIALLGDTIATDSVAKTIDTIAIPKIKTDTIGKTRFLTTMARQYYGEMAFWVYIYEENKEILNNPNQIKPGTIVNIPDAKKYGIDKNDSLCVERAKLKAIEIYAPYQK